MNTKSYEAGLLEFEDAPSKPFNPFNNHLILPNDINKNFDFSFKGNNSFDQKQNVGHVYVKVESVSIGSFNASDKATLKMCLTTRRALKMGFHEYCHEFHKNEKVDHTWSFTYKNKQHSSFVLLLFKRRYFGGDREIGEIELKLDAFATNSVTTHEFVLRSPNENAIPARVTLSVHLSENGSENFNAPQMNILSDKYEVRRKTTFHSK